MSTSYRLEVHNEAHKAIEDLDSDTYDRVASTLRDVAQTREVASHEKVEHMQNQQDVKLYKVRIGDYRALIRLDQPELQVLKFGHRQGFYSEVDDICSRL